MLSRRDLFTLNINKPQSPKAGDVKADIIIYVFQRGAADGLNLVVPYADTDYYANRPNLAIPAPGSGEGSSIDLDGFFGLNPDLSALLPMFNNGDLAMIHACGSQDLTHSHFETQAFIDRGIVDDTIDTGWLARYANSYTNESETAFKSIAMSAAVPPSLSGTQRVVALNSIEGFKILALESESELISNQLLDLFSGENSLDKAAQATFSAVDIVAEINPDNFPVENDAQYPDSDFANRLKDLALLIKSDVGIEIASVDIGGWDTHDAQAPTLTILAQDYSNSIAAFYYDMGDRMDNISIVTITEFGRRATENGSGGTDHGTGNVAFVMGGGVNGGVVYRDWPGLASNDLVGPGDLAATTDYRTIIAELMDKRLFYTDHETLFPDFEVPDYLGLFRDKEA